MSECFLVREIENLLTEQFFDELRSKLFSIISELLRVYYDLNFPNLKVNLFKFLVSTFGYLCESALNVTYLTLRILHINYHQHTSVSSSISQSDLHTQIRDSSIISSVPSTQIGPCL